MWNGKWDNRRKENGGDHKTLAVLNHHKSSVRCMCELSNGWVVSGSDDKTLKVWDMTTKKVCCTMIGHMLCVLCVVEMKRRRSADNNQIIIVSGSMDHTIRIWNGTTGQCLRVLRGHTTAVLEVVELSDGTLLSGSSDKTIRQWNINKAECVSVCETSHKITCMRQLRDGSIITGSNKGELEVRMAWTNR